MKIKTKKRTFFENWTIVNNLAKVRNEYRDRNTSKDPLAKRKDDYDFLTDPDAYGLEKITFWDKLKMMWRLQGLPSSRDTLYRNGTTIRFGLWCMPKFFISLLYHRLLYKLGFYSDMYADHETWFELIKYRKYVYFDENNKRRVDWSKVPR